MTKQELANTLMRTYENKAHNKTAMIILFGIKYAEEIASSGYTPNDILEYANMSSSYATEIYKGIRLSQYVTVNDRSP
jgi:hypothetical protein